MKRKPPPPAPWFRLRFAATLLLAGGVWTGVFAFRPAELQIPRSTDTPAGISEVTAPPLPAQPAHPARLAVVIDPGHGGKDPGKVAGDQYEKTWTLLLSQSLAEELRSRGQPVEMTRTDDTTLSLEERSAVANREPRAAFVSIHFNSGKPEANGIEVFYAWPKTPAVMVRLDSEHFLPAGTTLHDDRGRLLATEIQTTACEATGARNRGVKNDPGLAVLNRTHCPAILIECGFLTNPAECANIQSEEWRRKLAISLADCLEKWLKTAGEVENYGITYELTATPPAADGVMHQPSPAPAP